MEHKQLITSRSLNRIPGNLHYCILWTYKKKYKCSSLNPDDDLPSTYPRVKLSLCMQFLSLQCHLHNACVILDSASQGLVCEHCSAGECEQGTGRKPLAGMTSSHWILSLYPHHTKLWAYSYRVTLLARLANKRSTYSRPSTVV